MKLKEIYLRGFKSFLGPIRLNLSARIVAIVGPNGCGKSNIVDAVRWCLGEQNSRVLRGLKMEDVIFNGAGDVKPLGVAEVKLLLEDCFDETIPENLRRPEIEITRRLFRTGESEYLINNIPCRLKDIQEIFLGTGLGQRAYSIIGQGSIGAIIDYRPEQLRDLIHEAVDITRYERQIEQAQRRIAEAQENLLRVRDLVTEVEKQLSTLKRQAEKAKRYKRLTEEIQELELTLLCNEFNLLNRSLAEINRYCASLATEEASLRNEITSHEAMVQQMEVSSEEIEGKLKILRKTYARLKSDFETRKTLIQSKENELLLLEDRKKELFQEIKNLEKKLNLLESEKIRYEEEKVQILKKIDETKMKRVEFQSQIDEEEKKIQEIRKEYAILKDQFYSLEKQRHDILKDIEFLNKTRHEIEKRKQELSQERDKIHNQVEELKMLWKQKSEQKRVLEERLNQLDLTINSIGHTIQSYLKELRDLEERARSAEKEVTETKLKIKTLQELIRGYGGIRPGTRYILNKREGSEGSNGKVRGILVDLIEVEQGVERAVEALLGERLEYLVVGSLKDSLELLFDLKKEAKGKSGFIICQNGHREDLKDNSLVHLIKAPDELRWVLKRLLQDVELVESIEDIEKDEDRLKGQKVFVTKEGDIVFKGLFVYGGSEETGRQGLLTRKAQLRELNKRLSVLESELASILDRIKEVNIAIDSTKSKQNEVQKEKEKVSEQIRKYDYEMYRISSDIENKQKLLEITEKNIQRKHLEHNTSVEQLNDLQSKLNKISSLDTEKKKLLDELSQIIKRKEQSKEILKKEFYTIDASLRVLAEKETSIQKAIQKLDEDIKECKSRSVYLQKQLEENTANVGHCQQEIKNLSQTLQDIQQDIEDYRYQLNRKEEELDNNKKEISKLRSQIALLSENLNRLKDNLTKAKMSEAELKTEIKNILNMGIERHNTDISQIYENHIAENYSRHEIESQITNKKEQKEKLGEVNLLAISEYEETKKRYDFLKTQEEDIIRSISNINQAISKFRHLAKEGLLEGLKEINYHLNSIFRSLFNGGSARLRPLNEEALLESGMALEAELPNRRLTHLGLLSGGEKSLVALALLFAIFKCRPSPFCLLDEVDSALDDLNVERLCNYLQEFKEQTQIIMVTHKTRTMAIADLLYGVTMETKGVSKVVSADLIGIKKEKLSQ